jgi:hypothetical protein
MLGWKYALFCFVLGFPPLSPITLGPLTAGYCLKLILKKIKHKNWAVNIWCCSISCMSAIDDEKINARES